MNKKDENFFEGKKALVVGGTGGIGREISILLAENGAGLVIHGSKLGEKTESLKREILQKTEKIPQIIAQNLLDVPFDELKSSELFESARECDILCLCFGPFVQKPLHETSLLDWQKVALYDYALPGFLLSSSLPQMMKKKFGRILLFGGTGTGHRSEFSTNAAYAGAKSGLTVLAASTAANYARFGITCNAILPGFVETEYLSEEQKFNLSSKMPSGEMVSIRSIAKSALFLLKNADINGTTLRVDGGWSPSVFQKKKS